MTQVQTAADWFTLAPRFRTKERLLAMLAEREQLLKTAVSLSHRTTLKMVDAKSKAKRLQKHIERALVLIDKGQVHCARQVLMEGMRIRL